ncbi:hypothetical protein ACFO5O_08430 [Geojedonia litorea]|uniref:Uncharacterized protein n=1 Tax=Geojedonia litorea TaxID=1268269 RepID=A0ABV9N5T2_9FLAO
MSKKENKNLTTENKLPSFEITEKGSLGLLAYGDIGLRAWRKVKQEFYNKDSK